MNLTGTNLTGINLGDMLRVRAARNPDLPALFCGSTVISFGDLDASTDALAGWFLGQGLKPGDRVAFQWPNLIEAVQLYFGAFKAGLIAVPVNLRLRPSEIGWIVGNSGAAMCFSHPRLADAMRHAGIEPITALPELANDARPLPEPDQNAPAAILYTSGSTGRPKGVIHTHATLIETARICTQDFIDTYGTGETVRGLAMTPLMHASGIYVLLASLAMTQACVLLPIFDPGAALDAIEKFGCSVLLALPALLQFMLEEQERNPRDVSALKLVFAGGDSVPVSLQDRARELLGVEVLEGLAQTETGPSLSNFLRDCRAGSLGRPQKGVEVRLVDTQGNAVPDGEPGELQVKSGAVCQGYWDNPESSAEAFMDGWFRTGDLVNRDPDGYYWFRGRMKEIIVRGGSNISPQEVEEALYSHPEILEAGVVGEPHALWGEEVVAFVALRDGAAAGEDDIRSHARLHLADYKVPERVHFLPVLPKGATGKVHRKALRDQLLETKATAGNT